MARFTRVFGPAGGAGALTIAALLCAGCGAKQAVPLDCLSQEVRVYVDGRLLEENPDVLELDADEPHKLYFKRDGHAPQLIVLESQLDDEGRPRLSPSDVCVKLVPVGLGRELTIEADEDAFEAQDAE